MGSSAVTRTPEVTSRKTAVIEERLLTTRIDYPDVAHAGGGVLFGFLEHIAQFIAA
jgi:hypothetical protein